MLLEGYRNRGARVWGVTLALAWGLAPGRARAEAPRPTAVVTLVNLKQGAEALAALVTELLVRHAVSVQLSQESQLTRQELLALPHPGDPAPAKIWISIRGSDRARLYFGQPAQNRYVIRDIPLRSGLDELGREQVAQVVESATLALLDGAPALTREEIQEHLEDIAVSPAPEAVPPHPVPPPAPTAAPQQLEARVVRVTPLVGLGYSVQWSGSALGLLHGPSFRAGLAFRWRAERRPEGALLWPVQLAWEPRFPQQRTQLGIDLETRSQAFWLLAGPAFAPTEHWQISLQGGAGVELVRVMPSPSQGSTATTEPERSKAVPWLRWELGGALRTGRVGVRLSADVDTSLFATHYDVRVDGQTVRAFTPWLIRPGLHLGISFF